MFVGGLFKLIVVTYGFDYISFCGASKKYPISKKNPFFFLIEFPCHYIIGQLYYTRKSFHTTKDADIWEIK